MKLGSVEWTAQFRSLDAELDRAATGPRWLLDPKIAALVEASIIRGEELQQYRLCAYVVMPNHVHVLLEAGETLAHITRGIKGASAREANQALRRTGTPFWQDESFDHWIRNGTEFKRIYDYVETNPVTAGLARCREEWRWSSAWRKGAQARVPVPPKAGACR